MKNNLVDVLHEYGRGNEGASPLIYETLEISFHRFAVVSIASVVIVRFR